MSDQEAAALSGGGGLGGGSVPSDSDTAAQGPIVVTGTGSFASRHGSGKNLSHSSGHGVRNWSLMDLMGLFASSFSYAFVFNTLTNIVIPQEVARLAPQRQSVWVGLIMSAGALCQLATPIVGSWSDKSGQGRMPYLIYGSMTVICGIVLFLCVAQVATILLLCTAHIVTTVGLSVQYSMVTALLNDHIPDEQVGKGSGTIAILAILGSGAGYAMFATSTPLHTSYCAYIIATVFCLGICVLHVPAESATSAVTAVKHTYAAVATAATEMVSPLAPRKPTKRHAEVVVASAAAAGAAPGTGAVVPSGGGIIIRTVSMGEAIAAAISMPSPGKYPDFFFACLGRCLFNAGLAGQVYLVYYVRDVLASKDAVKDTSILSVAALVGGIIGALPSGILSDRIGKKPVIYGAIALCTVSLIFFVMAPTVYVLQFVGFIFGLGNVGYLSVDYALGVQALPRGHVDEDEGGGGIGGSTNGPSTSVQESPHGGVPIEPAKNLGVFAMSATVGQLLGQVLYGAILDQYTMTATAAASQAVTGAAAGADAAAIKSTHFTHTGFVVVYLAGALCFVLSGFSTSFIRGVR